MNEEERQRVAVVGAGAAGLVTAWLLQDTHEVVVFEAHDRIGGHIHTVHMDVDGLRLPVEIGAEFILRKGYPGLLALVDRLGLERRQRAISGTMSLSGGGCVQLPPRSAAAVWRCLSPRTASILYWMVRLRAAGERVVAEQDWTLTVRGFVDRVGVPRDVAEGFVIPLFAASWGVSAEVAEGLCAFCVVQVTGLRVGEPAHTIEVEGGLGAYIEALRADSTGVDCRTGSPVDAVERKSDGLWLRSGSARERFDAAVLACDWHNSARICGQEPKLDAWHKLFSSFEGYLAHLAVHRDPSVMPADRRLWSRSNFDLSDPRQPGLTVWSGSYVQRDLFRTWLHGGQEPPASTLRTADYRHIHITPAHRERQRTLEAMQGRDGVYAAGMYTDGIDNHESAVRSGLRVAERLAPASERVRWLAEQLS